VHTIAGTKEVEDAALVFGEKSFLFPHTVMCGAISREN
jgi:hypothetical protein